MFTNTLTPHISRDTNQRMQMIKSKTSLISETLNDILREKAKRNPSYSLRAMARDLSISPSFLSLLLNGKRRLSFKQAIEFCKLLKCDEDKSERLLKATALESSSDSDSRNYLAASLANSADNPQDNFYVLELDRFKFLSEWYHIAILDLTLVEGFKTDNNWIANQLQITTEQVTQAVLRLERLGLLEIKNKKWIKTNVKIAIPTTKSEKAIREFHKQMMDQAKVAIDREGQNEFLEREISGITMAINAARINEAKKRIQKFQRELFNYLTEGESTELYQLNLQFFRLSREKLTNKLTNHKTKESKNEI